MAKAIALYCGGIHGLVECAIRDDGLEFRRYQDKTPYGYRWGAWKALTKRHDPANLPTSISSGFSELYPQRRLNKRGEIAVRLPN